MIPDDRPASQRIADELRARIVSGELGEGDRLPSLPEIVRIYGVANSTAQAAVRILVNEGLVVSRTGSGTFVRARPQLQRLVRAWYRGLASGSPFLAEMTEQGRQGAWTYDSRTAVAPPEIRERLGLSEPDGKSDVLRTKYVFTADGEGVMLSTSWEPLELTRGTPIVMPEEGPHGGRGVVERMLAIGIVIDGWIEDVAARLGSAEECGPLEHAPGSVVLTIGRTYQAGGRVVEVADLVLPADRFTLRYSGPVGQASA